MGDNRFTTSFSDEERKSETKMCELLDKLENKGFKKGHAEGYAEGRAEELCALVRDGLITVTVAAKRLGMTEEKFSKLLEEMLEFNT